MRNFREEYRRELNQVPTGGRLGAERILAVSADGAREPAADKVRSRRRAWTRVAAAAAVLVVCSAGTVTAVNIRRGYIRVGENGYTVSKENPDETEALGSDSGVDSVETYGEDELISEEVIEDERAYDSLAEFRESEDLTFVCPEPEWLLGDAEPQQEQVYVTGDGDSVFYVLTENDDQFLFVNQWDARDAMDYGSATVYDGQSANERTYVTESGFDFVLFDSEADGETLSTHAVISLNGWELSLDFYGYDEETIESVLDRLELETYLK